MQSFWLRYVFHRIPLSFVELFLKPTLISCYSFHSDDLVYLSLPATSLYHLINFFESSSNEAIYECTTMCTNSSNRKGSIYRNLHLIEIVGTIIYPRMIFTKCFKMSVDESQWTHGFDVNWCDYFIMNFTTAVFYSLFSALNNAL